MLDKLPRPSTPPINPRAPSADFGPPGQDPSLFQPEAFKARAPSATPPQAPQTEERAFAQVALQEISPGDKILQGIQKLRSSTDL